MRGHVLTLLDHGFMACARCQRLFDLDGFLETPRCFPKGEWTEAALSYVQHAPELAE
jgi:hypothetical protein